MESTTKVFATFSEQRRLTLGCSRRGPLLYRLPSCAIMASRATRLNPGPLGRESTMEGTFSICADCGSSTNWLLVSIACVVAVMSFVAAKRLWRRGGRVAATGSVVLYASSAACIVLAFLA
jgi:hypothetical protein